MEELNEQINLDLIKTSSNGITDVIAYTLSIIDNDSNAVFIQEKTQEYLSIYPNPSNNFVKIKNKSQWNGIVKVYSILGETILTKPLSTLEIYEIDLSNWKSGIYNIVFEYDLEKKSFNFIKN